MSVNSEPSHGPSPEEQERTSQIRWLRSIGDREALFQILDADRQLSQGLEAAEALAELGDVRGLDHLIATLDGPGSYLRHQAAQILRRLNHPRGLRALNGRDAESADLTSAQVMDATRTPGREQIYGELSSRTTDDLMAIWHEHDGSNWSPLALEVLEDILKERLGRLPPRRDPGSLQGKEQIDEDTDPRIRALWLTADIDGLTALMRDDAADKLRLEAAEALADLGDEDAMDLLIEFLDDPDPEVRETAAEMLDWLDLPRGNRALQERGLEFETGPDDLLPNPPAKDVAPQPAQLGDAWAATRAAAPASPVTPSPSPQRDFEPRAWLESGDSSLAPLGVVFAGASGGLLGLLVFRVGLVLLGSESGLVNPVFWLRAPDVYYVLGSLVAGAIFGPIGARVAQAVGRRLGWEATEGDLLPILGAMLEGATTALLLNLFVHLLFGL